MADPKPAESKDWILEPETEYRFELDPGTSLAIKVCSIRVYLISYQQGARIQRSYYAAKQKFSEQN
jgi:hypothetical protein